MHRSGWPFDFCFALYALSESPKTVSYASAIGTSRIEMLPTLKSASTFLRLAR